MPTLSPRSAPRRALPLLLVLLLTAALTVRPGTARAVDLVPVTVSVLSFDALEDPDPAPGQGAGDFYARISFGDGTSTSTSQVSSNSLFTAPADWTLTTTVDRDAQATLDATIRILDDDDFPFAPDDEIDVDPDDNDLAMDITIDLTDGSWTGDSPANTGFSQGDGDTEHSGVFEGGEAGRLRFAVGLGPSTDIDGDGIPTSVERFGIRNDDGSLHTDMAALGADPCRKTIAIEADWLAIDGSDDLRPKPAGIAEAQAMFDAAPLAAVATCPYPGFPSSPTGVDLLVDVDSAIPWADEEDPFDLADLDAQRATDFDAQRDPYFFYNVWGFTHDGGGSSGVCCNDKGFLVTLGTWDDRGSVRQQAGTLVHELGHNIGLPHGGSDSRNYKPNYLSVMSYTYQTRGLVDLDAWNAVGQDAASYVPNAAIDYSRSALAAIDEDGLSEPDGVGGGNTAVFWRGPDGSSVIGDARLPLDWNLDGDGATDTGVVQDLNQDGICVDDGDDDTLDTAASGDDVVRGGSIWPGTNATCDSAASGDDTQLVPVGELRTDVLTGNDDWSQIVFAGQINAGLGGNTGPLDVEEITYEEHLRLVAALVEAANEAPVADAGADVSVPEGSEVQLDGTGSSDGDGDALTHQWAPADQLDDPTSPTPTFTGVDDDVTVLTLTVTDPLGLQDSDTVTVTTTNVDPTVSAVGDEIDEAGAADVSATFSDPGTLDTHTATVDWGDGTSEPVALTQGAGSGSLAASHVYGDDGDYTVTVTVVDDDGGSGDDTAVAAVANLDPEVTLDTGALVSFPGGDASLTRQGVASDEVADATDAGSDDLTFTWDSGPVSVFLNDGVAPDPLLSPFGTFPFAASDSQSVPAPTVGVDTIGLTVSDDDGGSAADAFARIVTGTVDRTRGPGSWQTAYRGLGSVDDGEDALLGYLEIVRFVSEVFDEDVALATLDDAADVLQPTGDDPRARARADLLVAWLHLASGATLPEDRVTRSGFDASYLELLAEADAVVADPTSSRGALQAARKVARVTAHAG